MILDARNLRCLGALFFQSSFLLCPCPLQITVIADPECGGRVLIQVWVRNLLLKPLVGSGQFFLLVKYVNAGKPLQSSSLLSGKF